MDVSGVDCVVVVMWHLITLGHPLETHTQGSGAAAEAMYEGVCIVSRAGGGSTWSTEHTDGTRTHARQWEEGNPANGLGALTWSTWRRCYLRLEHLYTRLRGL
eukprot:3059249-Prymnesium_polylepis.1